MRKPFPVISELISLAETVTHLRAVCVNTRQDASFTKLLAEKTSESERNRNEEECNVSEHRSDNDILIGGKELYTPVDRITYFST